MKLYELSYSTAPSLSEDEQKTLAERVISLLQIQPLKQSFAGFLTTLDFYSEPAKIDEIEKKLKAETSIQRFMIVKKSLPRLQTRAPRKIGITVPITEKKTEKPKVELEEIGKRLDEILKE